MAALQDIRYNPVMAVDNLADLGQYLHIWTPDGGYVSRFLVDREKLPSGTYTDMVQEAREREPSQRLPTSGEWHQIRKHLRHADPDMEKDMTGLPKEMTSTFLDYAHGKKRKKWYDGLVVQVPKIDAEGNFIRDEKGILEARDIWEMPLPENTGTIGQYPKEMEPLFDMLYGEEGLMEKIPDAYFWVGSLSRDYLGGLKSLFRPTSKDEGVVIRGAWNDCSGGSRFGIESGWKPSVSFGGIAARAIAEL